MPAYNLSGSCEVWGFGVPLGRGSERVPLKGLGFRGLGVGGLGIWGLFGIVGLGFLWWRMDCSFASVAGLALRFFSV